MKRVFFCGVLPSKYSGRWRGCPQFDFAKEKRNSPQTPLPLFLCSNGTGTEAGGQKFLPPQPPPFLPACLGFAPKTFRRTDGGTLKWVMGGFSNQLIATLTTLLEKIKTSLPCLASKALWFITNLLFLNLS